MGWLACEEPVDAAGGSDVCSASGGRGAGGVACMQGLGVDPRGSVGTDSNAERARDSRSGKTLLFVYRYRTQSHAGKTQDC